jgi:hypothetical protein
MAKFALSTESFGMAFQSVSLGPWKIIKSLHLSIPSLNFKLRLETVNYNATPPASPERLAKAMLKYLTLTPFRAIATVLNL